jgi:hypothetical protein
MELSPSWETASCAATMVPEGSLPCSQDLSTGPYPEPDESSPFHPILSKIQLNIIHTSTSWSS